MRASSESSQILFGRASRHLELVSISNSRPPVSVALQRRPVRSFVLRQGRFSPAQKLALERLLPRFGIPFSPSPVDLAAIFGRSSPKILEVGFGMGDTTAAIAAMFPQYDFLAVEVHAPGVGGLLRLIEKQELQNIRVVRHDAVEVVEHMIAPGALAGVHVFFPDPWPKKRHHKRRLLQSPFVHALAQRLQSGGYIHAATDWQEYATVILETLRAEPLLVNTVADYAPRPAYRPTTKFERRGLARGHGVWDVIFRRR
jgi:tRNA (guanine-N7-)-methyltransferase